MSAHDARSRLDVIDALRGQRVLITGATGFLGKVLVEKLLWSVPEIGELSLLIRPSRTATSAERLASEVFSAPIFARLRARHGDDWDAWVASKAVAVEGDLSRDRFGLDDGAWRALAADLDLVLGNAATVTFDERLDRAFEINAMGAARTLALAQAAGDVPLLHVSTCFVSGQRQGLIAERVVDENALDAEVASTTLHAAAEALRSAGIEDDRAWVDAGAEAAHRFGFHDVYTLTKALGERFLARDRGGVPLAIIRPAIVESAVGEPVPGWIEAVRVSDPLLVAYGKGRTDEFPGSADVPLELIPVDCVANATITALAALRDDGSDAAEPDGEIPVYQLGSQRNPITLGALMEHARKGYARTPLRDEAGEPIAPGPARFTEPEDYRRALTAQRARVRRLARWLPLRRTSPRRLALGRAERTLDHLVHLLSVYQPYLREGGRYDDTRTQELWSRLGAAGRATFPFDVTALDWPSYIADVHVPGLIRFALRAETGAPSPASSVERESSDDVLQRAVRHAAGSTTLYDLFAATAEADPDTMAFQTFRDGSWLRYTYRQASIASANAAWCLAETYGIGVGDRVVLWSTGCPEWVLATLAIHRLGATIVPLDPQWPVAEAKQAAALAGAKLICAMPQLVDALTAAAADGDLPFAPLAAPLVPEPDVPLFPGADRPPAPSSADALASIIFTSGTTVAPKAVPLTHANYLANVRDLVPLMKLTHERLLSVLPIHHVFEQMVGLLVPMTGGSTFSYVAELKPAEISWMMNTTRPTVLVAVPRLLTLLHNGIQQNVKAGGPMLKLIFKVLFALSRRKDGADGHKLFAKVHRRFGGSLRRIASGGSALDPDLGRSFQLMGFKVAEGYGMTETSPVLTVNPWDAIRFGSVGRPLAGVEIELRPPADGAERLEPGSGEVWVRGANVMAGYLENPAATAAAMRDGWLNTGDTGFFDEEGYLRLSGRTKDVIVTSAGKNVYPEEVEVRYKDLPGVAELVVLGLPTEGASGERVTALIVPSPGADEASIRAAVAARSAEVPSYQQVGGVEIWRGELPKTTTMKVKRAVLRDAVLAGERGSGAAPPTAPVTPQARTPAEAAVVEAVARLTRTRPDLIGSGDRLADLGVDSLTRVELVGELEARFGIRVDDDAAASLERVADLVALGR